MLFLCHGYTQRVAWSTERYTMTSLRYFGSCCALCLRFIVLVSRVYMLGTGQKSSFMLMVSFGRQMRQFSTTQTHKNASVSSDDAFCSLMCIHLLLPAQKLPKTGSNRLPKEARKLIYKVKQAHFLPFVCLRLVIVLFRIVR